MSREKQIFQGMVRDAFDEWWLDNYPNADINDPEWIDRYEYAKVHGSGCRTLY
jgi:hypothetical protein